MPILKSLSSKPTELFSHRGPSDYFFPFSVRHSTPEPCLPFFLGTSTDVSTVYLPLQFSSFTFCVIVSWKFESNNGVALDLRISSSLMTWRFSFVFNCFRLPLWQESAWVKREAFSGSFWSPPPASVHGHLQKLSNIPWSCHGFVMHAWFQSGNRGE